MIGELIKILRKKQGVGVMELSKKLGINRISLFRIERDQRQPSEKTAIKAFKVLGLSEEEIYRIFVFDGLLKLDHLSHIAKKKETTLFLERLNKKSVHGKILYGYFKRILKK